MISETRSVYYEIIMIQSSITKCRWNQNSKGNLEYKKLRSEEKCQCWCHAYVFFLILFRYAHHHLSRNLIVKLEQTNCSDWEVERERGGKTKSFEIQNLPEDSKHVCVYVCQWIVTNPNWLTGSKRERNIIDTSIHLV